MVYMDDIHNASDVFYAVLFADISITVKSLI